MRTLVLRIPTALRRVSLALARRPKFTSSRDETLMFSAEQIRFLARRGVIYLTKRPDGGYSTIVAHDYKMASSIAHGRGSNEAVIGLMGEGFLRHLRESSAGMPADCIGAA